MDYWKIIDSLYIIGPTSNFKSQGSLSTLAHHWASTETRWWFLGCIFRCTNARAHVWPRCTQWGGGGEETLWWWPTFLPLLLSEVNDLSLNSSGGFHNPTVVFREIHQLRRESWWIFCPKRNFGRPTINSPTHPHYCLFCRIYWNFLYVYSAGVIRNTSDWLHKGALMQWFGGRHKLSPQSAASHINFNCKV